MVDEPIRYGFGDQLRMSQGSLQNASVAQILMAEIPGAVSVMRASEVEDRQGIDYWVNLKSGRQGIDAKVRSEDWAMRGSDDLALEIWSVEERKIIGWTRDSNKRTDYVIWWWTDTGRWCLIPFPMLCAVFIKKWQQWSEEFRTARQFTPYGEDGWHSVCVFVPRKIVWSTIYQTFGGVPIK